MKIVNVCRYFYPFEGGVETFNLQLTRYLAKDNDIHVFTTNFPESKKRETKFGIKIHRYSFSKFVNEPLFVSLPLGET